MKVPNVTVIEPPFCFLKAVRFREIRLKCGCDIIGIARTRAVRDAKESRFKEIPEVKVLGHVHLLEDA